MNAETVHASALIFSVFLLFCRIGSCLMLAPGVSNTQIPMQVRLFVAIGATLALGKVLYLDLGYLGQHDTAKADAPSNTNTAGPYVGLGLHF